MAFLSDKNNNQYTFDLSENILQEVSKTKSKQLVKFLIEQSSKAIAVIDSQLRYLAVSEQWLNQYNLSPPAVIDNFHSEIFTQQSALNKYFDLDYLIKECLTKEISHQTEQIIIDREKKVNHLRLSFYPWYSELNLLSGIIIFSKLLNSEPIVEPFFDLSLDMLCIIGSDGYFKKVNSAFTKTLGYSTSSLVAKPVLDFVHSEDVEATLAAIKALDREVTQIEFENRCSCEDGSYRRLKWTATRASKDDGNLIYAVVRDITQSHKLQQQLFWQSKHDSVTGLLNRQEFEQKITDIITSVKITHKKHAFCYLDLDRFKVINDICGHLVGDRLLQKITVLIQAEITQHDILSRLGGDEFGLVLKYCSLEEAEQIAHNIRKKIQKFRFNWQEQNFVLGVSVGIAGIDRNSLDFSHLLSAADTACHVAKEQGRNWVKVYNSEDRELARHQGERHWISKINLALEENHFCLYCQKITPLQDNSGTDHYEILLRLLDREGKIIPPMAFIPAAEKYDLMPAIDRWVIKTFLDSYQDHCQLSNSHLSCETIYTINLSGASINSNQFFVFLKKQFAQHDIAPEKICFEITETSAIANLRKAAKFINEIKELGCFFALDDFGSGMSSLSYLKNLPVDYLKIDGNFVKNIVNDPVDRATVECFNRIGEVMNIQTIAEFVENDDIVAQLKEIGVNYAQGYGIDKPTPLSFQ